MQTNQLALFFSLKHTLIYTFLLSYSQRFSLCLMRVKHKKRAFKTCYFL